MGAFSKEEEEEEEEDQIPEEQIIYAIKQIEAGVRLESIGGS